MEGKMKTKGLIIAVIILIVILMGVIGLLYVQNKGEEDDDKEITKSTAKEVTTERTDSGFSTKDWSSFEISMDGKVYAWPISYTQLVDDGYVLRKEDIDYEAVKEKYDSMGHLMYKESDKSISISIAFKGYVLPEYNSPDCYAKSFSICEGFLKDNNDIVLGNGIKLGMSYDEVVSIMGWEEEKFYYDGSGDDRFDVIYENDDNTRRMSLTFVYDKLESIALYEFD